MPSHLERWQAAGEFTFFFVSLLFVLAVFPKLLCEARPTADLGLAPAFCLAFLLQAPQKVLESPQLVPSERLEPAQRQNEHAAGNQNGVAEHVCRSCYSFPQEEAQRDTDRSLSVLLIAVVGGGWWWESCGSVELHCNLRPHFCETKFLSPFWP